MLYIDLTLCSSFFFFNDTATTEIYTLSLHDALPILDRPEDAEHVRFELAPVILDRQLFEGTNHAKAGVRKNRSEEHTSELQSRPHLVCRLLLEKKKAEHPQQPDHPHACRPHEVPEER